MIMFATIVLLVTVILTAIAGYESHDEWRYAFWFESLLAFLALMFIAIPALEGGMG